MLGLPPAVLRVIAMLDHAPHGLRVAMVPRRVF